MITFLKAIKTFLKSNTIDIFRSMYYEEISGGNTFEFELHITMRFQEQFTDRKFMKFPVKIQRKRSQIPIKASHCEKKVAIIANPIR